MSNTYKIPVSMDNIIDINGDKWFLDYKTNTLYTIRLDSFKCTPVTTLPKGKFEHYPKVYGKLIHFNGKIYAIPEAPIDIAVYDLDTSKLEFINYSIDNSAFMGRVFSDAVVHRDYIYFIPCCYRFIVKYNSNNGVIEYVDLLPLTDNKKSPVFLWDGVISDEHGITFSTLIGDKVIRYSYEKNISEILFRVPKLDGIGGLARCGDNIWIYPLSAKKVYVYDKNSGDVEEKDDLFPKRFECGEWSFSRIIDYNKYTYLLPRTSNMVLRIDKEKCCAQVIKDISGIERNHFFDKFHPFSFAYEYDNRMVLFNSLDGCIEIYNDKQGLDEVTNVTIDMEDVINNIDVSREIMCENEICNFEWFIKRVSLR